MTRAWRRLALLESLKIGAVPVLVLTMALFFAFPWLPEPSRGGAALERYFPVRDGASFLVENYDADNSLVSSESRNMVMIPTLRAFTELREGLRLELDKVYGSPENMGNAQVMEVRRRTVTESGEISEATDTLVLEQRGLFLLGSREGALGADTVFDEPALLLPADLGPGKKWSSRGEVGSLDYRVDGRVVGTGAFDGPLGSVDDCLNVEVRTVFARAGGPESRTTFRDRYCAGVGLVESRQFDGSGETIQRSTVVSTSTAPQGREARLPPASNASRDVETSGDPAGWRLNHFGRLRPTGESTASTVPPTYVPADPPVVLSAAQGGDLVALDAGNSTPGAVRWRFHPDGTVYGPPAFDARTGRIYFGATDKKLYALDARGIFLWAFETSDNVASRPVVAGETVVFGSENRNVYGLDAKTGEERWKVRTGGPVVSSPALAAGVVVIGSDDGAVYGLDPATGEQRWLYLAEGPVEASIVAADGVAYVASRSGELVALDAGTGEEIWASAPEEILRTAPAVGETALYVVDDAYGLLAYDRRTGRKLWEIPNGSYVGSPLVVGEELLVATYEGHIERLGPGGERRGSWNGATAGNPIDGDPAFSMGPSGGGGVVWAATDTSAVLRIGPAAGPASIEPAWAAPFSEPPFSGEALQYTAANYRGDALMLGSNNNIYLVDAARGEARTAGRLDTDSGSPVSDPVVAGDTLLAASGDALYATRLPEGEALWRAGGGTGFRPPVVAGDRVLWLPTPGDGEQPTLRALDLRTGGLLWEAPLQGAGGVVVRGNTAYANPASAFDLESGDNLWRARSGGGSASGGPALSESGSVLFVGSGSGNGSVAAMDAGSGEEIWSVGLEGETVDSSDRLWISGNTLIVPSLSGNVIALDSGTGREVWRYTPPFPRLGNVTVERGRVWLALQNGEVLALDAESGEVAARSNHYSLNLYGSSLAQRPAFVGDRLVLGVGTYVLGLDPEKGVR